MEGSDSPSVDRQDIQACLRYAFRYSQRKPPEPGDSVYVTQWGYGTVTAYQGQRVMVKGDYGSLVFPLSRCTPAPGNHGLNGAEFYQYQKAHGLAGKSVVWHQKGQHFSDMPPFRFANLKAL